jgi:hypothetical protein
VHFLPDIFGVLQVGVREVVIGPRSFREVEPHRLRRHQAVSGVYHHRILLGPKEGLVELALTNLVDDLRLRKLLLQAPQLLIVQVPDDKKFMYFASLACNNYPFNEINCSATEFVCKFISARKRCNSTFTVSFTVRSTSNGSSLIIRYSIRLRY